MLYYDLPVYKDTFLLTQLVYTYVRDFPRDYKYTLGQDMQHDVMQLMRSIYRANKYRGRRTKHLDDFLDNFELLKLEIRLCSELKLLSLKKQARLNTLMDSIGRQAQGWRSSA